jgi:HlyD family secretion protein
MMKNKITILVAVLLLVLAGCAAAFWPFQKRNVLRFPGIVEVQEVRLGSKVGGRVEAVLVQEGDVTYKNQPLIVFEAPELKNQRLQVKARLDSAVAEWQRAVNGPRSEEKASGKAAMDSAKARYDRAVNGFRKEEIEQAESDFQSADADYEQAMKDWNRVDELYRQKAAARADYEAAQGSRDRTRARKDSARFKFQMMKIGAREEDKADARAEWKKAEAQYELLRQGTRQEEIDMARAKMDELKANLESIDINLLETTIMVPPNLGKAVIEVIAVRAGDLIPANQPVVRVLRVEDLWVKIFVPETQYGLVTLKERVDVTIDSYPGRIFKGKIIQRANISEFTPRNVQSLDERRHQVFAVKIQVMDPDGVFNAGMAAEVVISLD